MLAGSVAGGFIAQVSSLGVPFVLRGVVLIVMFAAAFRFMHDIGFNPEPGGRPLADYLDSLRLMNRYADARLLPAHGPVSDSTHTRVAELLAHHDDRLAKSLTALGEDTLDAHAVARKLGWTRRAVPFGELNPFNQMLAVNETAAHLDVLVLQGRVTVATVGGVNQYTRVR
jgi:hypothetical protein